MMVIGEPGGTAARFTLPSSGANPTPLGHAAKHGSQYCGWQIPFSSSRAPASLVFSDHFNMMMSSLASRKGTNVPVLISAVSTARRTRCVRLGRHLGKSPSHVLGNNMCNAHKEITWK